MKKILIGLIFAVLFNGIAQANMVEATLFGDPREANPDNLIIDVKITWDSADPGRAFWEVDINSPLHPNAKLDKFYFNLALGGFTVAFENFDPSDWIVNVNESVQGGGNITFDFGAVDTDPGGENKHGEWITNTNPLKFEAVLQGGATWTENMFLDALQSCSTDQTLGCGQLGAHLQSLTVVSGTGMSDSGFLLGNYRDPGNPVPEPATMLLFGTGLVGLAGIARRKRS